MSCRVLFNFDDDDDHDDGLNSHLGEGRTRPMWYPLSTPPDGKATLVDSTRVVGWVASGCVLCLVLCRVLILQIRLRRGGLDGAVSSVRSFGCYCWCCCCCLAGTPEAGQTW